MFIPAKSKLKLGSVWLLANNAPTEFKVPKLKATLLWAAVMSAVSCFSFLTLGLSPTSSAFLICSALILWAADNDACWLTTTAAPLTNCPDLLYHF